MQESRYVKVARLAYQIAKEQLPLYSHPKSPHRYTFPQLATCVILTFYLNKSYRDMEQWLLATDKVCSVLGLKHVPDHSTLCRAYARLSKAFLERLLESLLQKLSIQEELICLDTTGFRETHESAYYLSRTGRRYRFWRKAAYAVGAGSQMILAIGQAKGPGCDAVFLGLLKRRASRWGKKLARKRAWLCLADSGFDGEDVTQGDIIPPIRRGGSLKDPQRIARKELVLQARLDGVYGQRWKAETAISVIKRKFGDTIRSRKECLKAREVAIKGLAYAFHR